jgi:hypothetical protein
MAPENEAAARCRKGVHIKEKKTNNIGKEKSMRERKG